MTVAGVELAAATLSRRGRRRQCFGGRATGSMRARRCLPARATPPSCISGGRPRRPWSRFCRGWRPQRAIVDAAEAVDPNVRVACTRKALSLGRRLSHLTVNAGGAILHCAGLSKTILVFAEHGAFLGGEFPRVDRHEASARRPREEARHRGRRGRRGARGDRGRLRRHPARKFLVAAVTEVSAIARGRASPSLIAAAGGVNAAECVGAGAGLIVTSAPMPRRLTMCA